MSSYGLAEVDNRMPLHYETGKRRMKKRYIVLALVGVLVIAAAVVIPTVVVLRKNNKKSSDYSPKPGPPNGGTPSDNFVRDDSLPVDSTCKQISNTSDPTGGYGPIGTAKVTFKSIVTGLQVPWQLAYKPGTTIMFLTEKAGRISQLSPDDGSLVLLATVPNIAKPDFAPEGGLLGIAFAALDKDYLYVYVTSNDTARYTDGLVYNRVERWNYIEAEGATATPSATFDKVIFDNIPAGSENNGGKLQLRNNYLYIGTGDAGNYKNAQDVNSKSGKILRISLDGSIPADNPFPGSATWIYGLRNVGGFDWLDDNTIVLADHANNEGDRIMVAKKGENMGWGIAVNCQFNKQPTVVAPRLIYTTTNPPADVLVYNQTLQPPTDGNFIPAWRNHVLVTSLRGRQLQDIVFDTSNNYQNNSVYFKGGAAQGGLGRIRDLLLADEYVLYVTTSNCDKRGRAAGFCNETIGDGVYRFEPVKV